jgi:hypothetical protein
MICRMDRIDFLLLSGLLLWILMEVRDIRKKLDALEKAAKK